jgi:ABC-type transporter Mla subunit MlaD
MTEEQRKQFKQTLETARRTRDELAQKRTAIDRELMQQSRVIAAVSELLGETIDSDIGITEATLMVIRAASEPMTPTQVRDELRKIGYDIDSFSNPMASLHQVLKRLEDKGEIWSEKTQDGKRKYVKAPIVGPIAPEPPDIAKLFDLQTSPGKKR